MTTFQARGSTTGSGVPMLSVTGDIDVASAEELVLSAFELVGDGRVLVLDLGEVAFMDSTGLSALIKIRTRLAERGGDIRIAALSRAVRRVLELVGMLDAFVVESTPGD